MCLENFNGNDAAVFTVVLSGAFAAYPVGIPGPKVKQLEQAVSGADEQALPAHLLQPSQRKLPEIQALLNFPEDRLRCHHTKGASPASPFLPYLPSHPISGRQFPGGAAPGRGLRPSAVVSHLLRNERIHT